MFERLPASGPPAPMSLWQGGLSVLVHTVLVLGAIQATRGMAMAVAPRGLASTVMVWTPPPLQPVAVGPTHSPVASVSQSPPLLPPLVPPIDVPIGIPPINRSERFDPRAFTGRAPVPGPGTWTGGEPSGAGAAVLRAAEVDQPVVALQLPRPVYPPALQQAGIAGHVVATFVVDTLGRVEPESWSVEERSHPHFEEPVRRAVLAGRFQPARVRGQPVRQLVRQRFSFTIGNP